MGGTEKKVNFIRKLFYENKVSLIDQMFMQMDVETYIVVEIILLSIVKKRK